MNVFLNDENIKFEILCFVKEFYSTSSSFEVSDNCVELNYVTKIFLDGFKYFYVKYVKLDCRYGMAEQPPLLTMTNNIRTLGLLRILHN